MSHDRWVAFLRGMNLGGRRLTNDELCDALSACGCEDAQAYQASGNVVFRDVRPEDELTVALEDGLAAELGYPVPTFLRSADEVRSVAAAAPFGDDELRTSTGKRQVVFLRAAPTEETVEELESIVPRRDRIVPAGRDLHWLPAGGLSDSELDFRRLDEITGGTTVRTHGTVKRLAAKFL